MGRVTRDTINVAQWRAEQAAAMSESELLKQVLDIAQQFSLMHAHIPDRLYAMAASQNRHDALWGAKGFPDLVLCGWGRLYIIELKAENGQVRSEQALWLQEMEWALDGAKNVFVGVLRPSDLVSGRVHDILKGDMTE